MVSDKDILSIFATLLAIAASIVSIITEIVNSENIYYSIIVFAITFALVWLGGSIIMRERREDPLYRKLLDRNIISERRIFSELIRHIDPREKTLKLIIYEEMSEDREIIAKYPPQFKEKAVERMLVKYQQILVQYGIEMDSETVNQLRYVFYEEWEDLHD